MWWRRRCGARSTSHFLLRELQCVGSLRWWLLTAPPAGSTLTVLSLSRCCVRVQRRTLWLDRLKGHLRIRDGENLCTSHRHGLCHRWPLTDRRVQRSRGTPRACYVACHPVCPSRRCSARHRRPLTDRCARLSRGSPRACYIACHHVRPSRRCAAHHRQPLMDCCARCADAAEDPLVLVLRRIAPHTLIASPRRVPLAALTKKSQHQ